MSIDASTSMAPSVSGVVKVPLWATPFPLDIFMPSNTTPLPAFRKEAENIRLLSVALAVSHSIFAVPGSFHGNFTSATAVWLKLRLNVRIDMRVFSCPAGILAKYECCVQFKIPLQGRCQQSAAVCQLAHRVGSFVPVRRGEWRGMCHVLNQHVCDRACG